jgi:hypothetical protein
MGGWSTRIVAAVTCNAAASAALSAVRAFDRRLPAQEIKDNDNTPV